MMNHINPYQSLANNSDSTSGGTIFFAFSTFKGKIAKEVGAFFQVVGRTQNFTVHTAKELTESVSAIIGTKGNILMVVMVQVLSKKEK